jgi:hypothetical protein
MTEVKGAEAEGVGETSRIGMEAAKPVGVSAEEVVEGAGAKGKGMASVIICQRRHRLGHQPVFTGKF